ncbi:Putative DMT superfamily metabolite efflux protein precursor [Salmonella enterica subsp. enterica serovar Typhimurium]|nr:Putative DMT superfamily metabolite efflux protein precursor [Salmonella enterica subsp. enterica serovar Typhimurium]
MPGQHVNYQSGCPFWFCSLPCPLFRVALHWRNRLFPLVGAPGVTALRLALGTLILIAFFKPWRLRFAKEQRLPLLFYGLSLGGMNYLFYLSIQTVPLGIAVALEFYRSSGGRAVFIPAAGRFYLGRTGCAWALVPAAIRTRYVSRRSYRGRVGARRWRLLGCLYSYRPASRRGTWSGHGGGRLADCRHHFSCRLAQFRLATRYGTGRFFP